MTSGLSRILSLASLLFLLAGCSTKPVTVHKPYWPAWADEIERQISDDLAAAASAWDALAVARPGSAEYARAEAAYEYAITQVLQDCGRRQLPRQWENGHIYSGKRGRFSLGFPAEDDDAKEISAHSLDRLRLADSVKLGLSRTTMEEGLGVPVVGQIMRTEAAVAKQPLLPLNGGQLTLTAILEFDPPPAAKDQPRRATLRLFNPLHDTKVVLAGRKVALAANYTPAKKLALKDGFLRRFTLIGLLRPAKVVGDCRLYLLDPYDPKRIPVVFVHGLLSNPHIWYSTVNAINADPELRARYQPWYFLFPSGLDVPYSAQKLRESLIDARNTLDPDHNDPGMNQMVLVGHSMGGLLCRLQTMDSGDRFWRASFTRPPEELKVSEETRQRLVSSLHFNRQPYVRRLIFIATPHRGSSIADIHLIYRLRHLISLPVESLLLTKEVLKGNASALTPQIRAWGSYAFLSLGSLSPKHPYFQALNSAPIPVPHHSIIARIGLKSLEQSSDGVVPYQSSHLETGTELVVNRWHPCAEQPEVVTEILQRLKQHLRELR